MLTDSGDEDYQALIREATAARAQAYAPYSGFKVGAALRGASGRVYRGCNVENASYGLTCCAERNAVFAAVVEGERHIVAAAVVTGAKTPTAPCGACRQVLLEFAPRGEMGVALATLDGARHLTSLAELLPQSFSGFEPDDGVNTSVAHD